MASALENKHHLHKASTTTPVAPDTPARNRTQISRFGLGREHLTSQRNIWQTVSNFSGHSFGDDRRADVFPSASGRTAKPAGPALPRRHDAGTSVNDDKHDSRSTTASSRVITRPTPPNNSFKSYGVLYANGNLTMGSSGNSSLLTGSAPDIDPSGFLPPGFEPHRDAINGKNLRTFDFEGVEDFVPSYLRGQSNVHPQRSDHGTSRPSSFQRNQHSWAVDGPDGLHDFPAMPSHEIPSNNSLELDASKHVFEANAGARDAHDYEILPAATYPAGSPRTSMAFSSSLNPWSPPPTMENTTLNGHGYLRRAGSNLRPEVAVYQPTKYTVNDAHGVLHTLDAYRTRHLEKTSALEAGEMYPQASNQILSTINSDAFATNTSFGSLQDPEFWSRTFQPSTAASSVTPTQNHERAAAHGEKLSNGPDHARTMQYRSKSFHKQQRSPHASECVTQLYFPPGHHNNMYGDSHNTTYYNSQSTGPIVDSYHFTPEGINEEMAANYQADRSTLLQEFAATYKQKKWEIKDIKHHVVEFCGDSNGSRWIQEKMDHATTEEKEQIWSEILTNVRQLMNDTYGNYVIQKLFDHGTQSQKRMLGNHMKGYMFFLSMQTYGCRVVQKAFEHILTDQQASLVKELEGHVIKVVESQHGNHVIQKAIETIPAEYIQFIVDAHKHQVVRLARHTYGCRVIQRILEHCTPQAKRPVLDELHCAIPVLIDDPFGNYVIQNIITKGSPSDRHRVVGFVQQRLLYYSTHKFASNVVEKAIEHADDHQRSDMLRQLTSSDPNNFMLTPVLDLIKDQYGNYVMQTVLKRIQGPAKRRLVDEVRHHLYMLGNTGHSKQVMAMSKTLNDVTAGHSPSSASTSPQTPHTPTSSKSGGINTAPSKNPVEIILSGQGVVLPMRPGPV